MTKIMSVSRKPYIVRTKPTSARKLRRALLKINRVTAKKLKLKQRNNK